MNLDRRIIFMNHALEILTGFSRQDVKGIPCYHVIRGRICMKQCPVVNIHDDLESIRMESDIINHDRQMVPVKIRFALVKDFQNRPIGFMETFEDLRSIRALNAKMGDYNLAHIIGRSPQMVKIFNILPAFAQSDSSVLITGETGTGKDLVAEAIHQASERARNPFLKINCGALPESLMESELFGHQKGAFTGAVENKPGRFKLAHNGTLFLTEIGDLSLSLQVKLLTFLDDRIIFPLGSSKGIPVNVRIIAATHRNLEQMVKEECFRKDLLFRLNVVRIHLPPLREREDDIKLLLNHFFKSFTSKFQKPIKSFSKRALSLLLNYHYPGNVRELRNIVEYSINICQENLIQPEHLPSYLIGSKSHKADPIHTDSDAGTRNQIRDITSKELTTQPQTLENLEKQMIMDALIKAGGRKARAAEILGWGRSTLWRKIKQYHLDS
jgi:transcriptional regulator with PAS, ATPase and Fis domain